MYVRSQLCKHITLVKQGPQELMWLLLDKNGFSIGRNIMLCCCYIPPDGSSSLNNQEHDLLDVMVDDMSKFVERYDCDFLICGDLNCRVGTAADFIENDYDRYVPLPDDYEIDEGCQNTRSNQDKTINTNGRQLLDVCKMTNLRILNGRVGDDAGIGATTCHKYNGCSTVDLVLCSPPLIPTINHFSVLPQHPFSDHSAIRFSIVVAQKPCENAFKKTIDKMIWNHQDKDIFVESMQSQDVLSIFSEMIEITERNSVDEESVNTAVILCTDAIRKAAEENIVCVFC